MWKYKPFNITSSEWVELTSGADPYGYLSTKVLNRKLALGNFHPDNGTRMTIIIDNIQRDHLKEIAKEWRLELQQLMYIILDEFIDENTAKLDTYIELIKHHTSTPGTPTTQDSLTS